MKDTSDTITQTVDKRIKRSSNTFLGDTIANFKRWFFKFIRSPPLLIMNLLQPILFLLMFTEVFGQAVSGRITQAMGTDIEYVTYLLPAIVIQVSIMTSESAGMNIVRDMDEWIFEKIMVSPMSTSAVFLGKTLSEVFRISIQISIIIGLGLLLGAEISTGVWGMLGLIAVGILFALLFSSIMTTVAMITKDQEMMMSIMMPVMFPLIFLSSAFLPLKAMPEWIQTFARYNPVTYAIDAARAIILDQDVMTVIEVDMFSGMWNTVIPAVGILLILIIIFGGLAVYTIKKETSSEVK